MASGSLEALGTVFDLTSCTNSSTFLSIAFSQWWVPHVAGTVPAQHVLILGAKDRFTAESRVRGVCPSVVLILFHVVGLCEASVAPSLVSN